MLSFFPRTRVRGYEGRLRDLDLAVRFIRRRDGHVDDSAGEQRRDALRPFDDDYAALLEQLAEADRFEIVRAVDPVGVEVEDAKSAGVVDVQQDERGTADRARVATESADEAADELRLAGTELAVQRDALPAPERRRELRGDGFRLLDAGGGSLHAGIVISRTYLRERRG